MSYPFRDPSPLELAQGDYSDFYKDVYGFRPGLPLTIEDCERGMKSLSAVLSLREKSFAGRMGLRMDGWNLPPESDPVLAKYSEWIMAEEERERAEWYSGLGRDEPEPLPYEDYEVYA
jgi:hypothetical protein